MFPPLNSFRTLVRKLFKFSLHKTKLKVETILDFQGFKSSKKISFRGTYYNSYDPHVWLRADCSKQHSQKWTWGANLRKER
jgi:hypothetical protein